MAQKKIPARQCIGCMTSRPKKELVRVVRAPSGEISIDLVGKKPGRGAYLCPDPDCLTKAKKKKALERCFEQPVPAEVYDALAVQLAAAAKEASSLRALPKSVSGVTFTEADGTSHRLLYFPFPSSSKIV